MSELKYPRLDQNALAIAETYQSIVEAFLRVQCCGVCKKCNFNDECDLIYATIKKLSDSLIQKGVFTKYD